MLRKDDTVILGTPDVAREFFGAMAMRPGDKKTVAGIAVAAMPAKTIRHHGGHDEEGFVLGFLLEADGKRVYYTSDTDLLPSMAGIAPDVLLLPVGGTTTMGPAEAAKAAGEIMAGLAIPIHWGTLTGTSDDAELFREYAEKQGIKALILRPGGVVEI
jgi:L-ascorbate metabolism protein UlaG (beta-lactamase superfamily)